MIFPHRSLLILISIYLTTAENATQTKGFIDYLLGNGPRFCKCICGRSNTRARILGGQYIEANDYPWLVLMHFDSSSTTATGTLINDRYVMTSANQVLGLTPYDIKVTLGEYNRCELDVTTANQSVDAIHIHPEYDPLTRGNDLALIRLSNALTTDRWISPICLPQPGEDYVGLVGTVIGWGAGPTEEDATLNTCRPRKVGLPLLSTRECLIGGSNIAYTRDKGCAGVLGNPGVICSTDSGSPVVHVSRDGFYHLIGVLTDSNVCKEQSTPTLYTKVNDHFTWLFQKTRDSCYCGK